MSDFGASISLSRDHSSSSSSDRAPLSPAPLSSGGARLTTTPNNNNNTVVEEDSRPRYPNNRQLMLSTPISRKPRGRPPGSKNKPKAPIIITRDSELAVKSAVVDVPAGCCIVDRIMKYACENGVGVSVQTVSGSVAAVTLRQPAPHAPLLTLTGPFNILSLHGTFLGGCSAAAVANADPGLLYSRPFTIVFSGGAQPQVAGGLVSGSLVAASHVSVTLSTFAAPVFHSMGSDDPDQDRKDGGGGSANGGGGGAGGNEGFGGGNVNGGGGVSTGMSMGMYGGGGGGGTPINPPKMSRTQDVLQWAASASGSHPPPAAY